MDLPSAGTAFIRDAMNKKEDKAKRLVAKEVEKYAKLRQAKQHQLKLHALEYRGLNNADNVVLCLVITWLVAPMLVCFCAFVKLELLGGLIALFMLISMCASICDCYCCNIDVQRKNRQKVLRAAQLGREQLDALNDLDELDSFGSNF